MVVYSATRAPEATEKDTLYALWSLLRDAREEPFEAGHAQTWRAALASRAVRIDAALRGADAPYALTTACDRLVRGISAIDEPSILDVIHVSEQLIQMEMQVARMRNRQG
ncbi:MAG: hypothetical protein ABI939_02250 [Anaerolineaceae bacterium]